MGSDRQSMAAAAFEYALTRKVSPSLTRKTAATLSSSWAVSRVNGNTTIIRNSYELRANLAASEGSTTSGGTVFFGTGFINNNVATIKVSTIHFFDSTLSSFSIFEFNESESLTPAGELI